MIPLESDLTKGRILVIDDEPANLRLLERILKRAGFQHVATTIDPCAALDIFDVFRPDLVLLDLKMAPLDGFTLMRELLARVPEGAFLPILVLSAAATSETRQRALSTGARDFLAKPFDPIEVVLRIRNLLETRLLHQRLQEQNTALEAGVEERTRELEDTRIEILECLGRAAEYRDDATGEHTRRVGELSGRIALQLGLIDHEVERIRRAATLHDIGKIGIPDHILLKPGKLTAGEFRIMRTHTTIGGRILAGSRSPMLQVAREIALTHHERWDGTGYGKMSGEMIPLVGRIVAIADTFDALTHERPYKEPWPRERAVAEIERERGHQFDPEIADAFLCIVDRDATNTVTPVAHG